MVLLGRVLCRLVHVGQWWYPARLTSASMWPVVVQVVAYLNEAISLKWYLARVASAPMQPVVLRGIAAWIASISLLGRHLPRDAHLSAAVLLKQHVCRAIHQAM